MKTKQISGKREILLVEFNQSELFFGIHKVGDENFILFNLIRSNGPIGQHFSIGKGDIRLLCRLSEITEEQAAELVGSKKIQDVTMYPFFAKAVSLFLYWECVSAFESLDSLLVSAGVLFENPEGSYSEAHKRHIVTGTWEESESNVFRPESTLVFVKQ